MNQQLQQQRNFRNLGVCIATSDLMSRGIVANPARRSAPAPADKGRDFAMAIKAKFDGSRPTVEDVIFATLERSDLKLGKHWLKIEHCVNPEARNKPYYSTKITNRSTQRIRIDRFGSYIKVGKTLVLHSITGGFFSRQQFQQWYGLGDSQWLEPGQTVIDPNNHSQIGVYWGYSFTTANGAKFVAAAAWKGKPWWQMW
jgi:hypothetical protein